MVPSRASVDVPPATLAGSPRSELRRAGRGRSSARCARGSGSWASRERPRRVPAEPGSRLVAGSAREGGLGRCGLRGHSGSSCRRRAGGRGRGLHHAGLVLDVEVEAPLVFVLTARVVHVEGEVVRVRVLVGVEGRGARPPGGTVVGSKETGSFGGEITASRISTGASMMFVKVKVRMTEPSSSQESPMSTVPSGGVPAALGAADKPRRRAMTTKGVAVRIKAFTMVASSKRAACRR